MLRLTLLGPINLCWDGQPVAKLARPVRALLACIGLAPQHLVNRDKLAAIIWGDLDEVRAKSNLRNALFHLRSALPQEARCCLITDRERIGFESDTISVDAIQVLTEIETGTVPPQKDLAAAANILIGLEGSRDSLAAWQEEQKRDFVERVQLGLHSILEKELSTKGATVAAALLQLDRSDETAARYLMRHAHVRGDTGKSLRVYSDLWGFLDTEFDAEPSEATQDLIVAIKNGANLNEPMPDASAQTAATRRPSVCVGEFPLMGVSQRPPIEAITLREEIIGRLARFRELRVLDAAVADTGVAQFRLDPFWQADAGEVAFVATLKTASDGATIWSYINDRLKERGAVVPSSVAASVASACGVEISRARLTDLLGGVPRQDAVDEWLMGQNFIHRLDRPDWEQAEYHFRQAQSLEPDFSKALSSLAQIRNVRHLVTPGEAPSEHGLSESAQLAAAAVKADPLDGQAYLAQAWAACLRRRYGHAEAAFTQATRLCPDDPWIVLSSALGAAFSGRQEDAARGIARYEEEGWAMTPLFWTYRSNIRFLAGDIAGCIADVEATEGGPVNLPGWRAAACALLGQTESAAEAWLEFETRARARTRPDQRLSRADLQNWFLSCFPLRRRQDKARLLAGTTAAITALSTLIDTA